MKERCTNIRYIFFFVVILQRKTNKIKLTMSKQDKKELRQQIACEWLEQNYLNYGSLRHDIVGDRLQIRIPNLESLEDARVRQLKRTELARRVESAQCLRSPHSLTKFLSRPKVSNDYYAGAPIDSCSLENAPEGLQFRGKDIWRNLTDKDINTMVCQCVAESGVNISVTEMWTALKSDLVPAVHPLREWLNGLRPWSSSEPDWIDIVAQKVRVVDASDSARTRGAVDRAEPCRSASPEDRPTGCSVSKKSTASITSDLQCSASETNYSEPRERSKADALWRECFKKWFVAMVASWMKDEVVNHTVLVLVGRQGIYKTTWLDRLMPPELRAYSSKLPLSGQISKDDRLRLCENGLLNIDELDAICGREMNIVKSLLTSTDVNERAAYGRLKERRVRLASFCASTNNREFLTDITGNRRWLPFEVESIQNPFDDIILYERLYAQAKAYVEYGYFAYWFDMDEIEVLEQHNEKFRALENEEELLPILFDKPAEGKGEFMTTAEISDRLVTYGGIKRPMSIRQLGMLLGKKGFEKKQVYLSGSTVRGWMIYKRDTDEITLAKKRELDYASMQPNNLF